MERWAEVATAILSAAALGGGAAETVLCAEPVCHEKATQTVTVSLHSPAPGGHSSEVIAYPLPLLALSTSSSTT